MTIPPSGTVTFLFTDIEGSTRLAQQHPAAWPSAQARHHAILQSAIESHGGYVFQIIADAFCAAFHTAPDALTAALDAQRALHAEPWDGPVIRVRMGLHTGAATLCDDGNYEGYLTLARSQRIMAGACGGQVLMSQEVAELVGRDLPAGVGLRDLGTHRLKDLATPEHLFQVVAQGLPADFPPLKTADHPNNLPTQLTSLVGRDAEVAEVRRLLAVTRLLTLSGAGGVGKTRLALQVAAEEQATFPDGAWFVELAPLANPSLIPSTIASAVGVREEPNRPMLATLGDHLRAKTALLVLDNCEHLISDAAQVCDTLLHAAPHLSIIATSREALGIAGETAYRVPSLGLPASDVALDALTHVASVQLFGERARAAKTDFALTNANASAVAQICRRLDGIPLAIELAAARVKALSPEQIATRLDDRFRLLTGGSRTAMPRQQTLRGAIDWSFSLLSDPERILLRRLAVFAGGWTLEAAESVCADETLGAIEVLELLMHLVDKSLVVAETTEDAVRYRMLETVRQYARERLLDSGDGEQLRNRHLNYFLSLAQAAEPQLRGPNQVFWFRRLETEIENLRGAMDWGQDSRQSLTALRVMNVLAIFWVYHGHADEGIFRLCSSLSKADATGQLLHLSRERARALFSIGDIMYRAGTQLANVRQLWEEGLAIATELGDQNLMCMGHRGIGLLMSDLGEHDQAYIHLEESLRLAHTLNSALQIGLSSTLLGHLHLAQSNSNLAEKAIVEGLGYLKEAGDLNFQALAQRRLGYLALERNERRGAGEHFRLSLSLNDEIGDRDSVATSIVAFASLALTGRQLERAVHLLGATEAILEAVRGGMQYRDRIEQERIVGVLHSQMDRAAFDTAWSAGRAMSYDEAIAYALEGSDA